MIGIFIIITLVVMALSLIVGVGYMDISDIVSETGLCIFKLSWLFLVGLLMYLVVTNIVGVLK